MMNGRHGNKQPKPQPMGRKLFALAVGVLLTLQGGALPMFVSAAHAELNTDGKQVSLIPSLGKSKTANTANRISPDTDAEPVYTMQQLDDSDDDDTSSSMTQSQPLQGSITSIRVVRGRSQIVKFAQPIMRISITEPTVADVVPLSPDQIMINGKLRGVTSLIVWDENGQEGIFDLYVQNDTSELLDAVAAIAPNEKIQARVTDDSFILSGQVSNTVILDEIRRTAAAYGFREDKFVDLTETPVPQVVLEVKIAEANRSVVRDLQTGLSTNNLTSASNTIAGVSRFDSLGDRESDPPEPIVTGRLPSLINPHLGGITGVLAHAGSAFELAMRFNLLQTNGQINILANPTLVCTHGREAAFLAGGEFPFVGGTDQNGSPIISFKEFGVKLKFTPWIAIRSGRIELKVEPEVSSRDTSSCVSGAAGSQVCGILIRKTSTTVEMQDNDSLMISGILSREEQNSFSKTPFIGDIPILKNMFKNATMNKADRELVVIITPKIVKSSHYGKLLGSSQ